jgi:hypothetical protein
MTDDTTRMTHRAQALSYALSLLTGGGREGRDATGVVAVRLTAAGATESIALSEGWQLRLPADKVAAAVTDAAKAAKRDAFTDAMRAISELPDSIDDVVVPADFAPPAPSHPVSLETLLGAAPDLDRLNASLDHAQGLVDAVTSTGAPTESSLSATPDEPVVFRTDAAGAILECAIDPTWAKAVRASALNDELWTAFTKHLGGH